MTPESQPFKLEAEAKEITKTPYDNIFGISIPRGPNPKHYYKDIWCLGVGTDYPGAFPKGLIDMFLKRWNGTKKIMLFSGSFHEKGWDTVDIKKETKPKFLLNAEQLPGEWTDLYDIVFADPPYSKEESLRLYGLPYFNIIKVVNEMARITKTGKYMALLHRLIPQNFFNPSEDFNRMKIVGVIGVYTIAGVSNIRALTVWRKSEALI